MLNKYIVNLSLRALGLSEYTSRKDIKERYLLLSNKYHPDKNTGSTSQFQEINSAYEILKTYKEVLHVQPDLVVYQYDIPLEKIKTPHSIIINGITIDIPVIDNWKQLIKISKNVALYIVAKKHSFIKRNNNDLLLEETISSIDAIVGKTINVNCATANLDIVIPPLTKNNTVFEYKDLGIGTGSMFIKIKIETPDLDTSVIDQLKTLFQ